MKKIIVLLLASAFITTANAQFQKGDKLLGLGLNVNSSSLQRQENNFTQISKEEFSSISTELGFATKQNLVVGFYLSGGLGTNETEYRNPLPTTFKSKLCNVGGGLFVRNYKKLAGNFFVFGDLRTGINAAETKNTTSDLIENNRLGVSAGIYPGLAYKWNSSFLLDIRFSDLLSINYTEQRSNMGATAIETKNFNVGSSLGLGYLYNIGIGARWIIK